MNRIFRDLYDHYVSAYLDDILIFSKSFEEHLIHIDTVLTRLSENRLYCKLMKAVIAQTSVDFCGHFLSRTGVSISPSKISAILQLPEPRNLVELHAEEFACYKKYN